jgi:hypothetical protein
MAISNRVLSAYNQIPSIRYNQVRKFGKEYGHSGGAGMGNVKDQMIAAKENLFTHTKRPKTVNIIGYVCFMIFLCRRSLITMMFLH